MKLLFAIKNMHNAKGGAEKVLSIIVNGLIELGHDVSLVTFDPPDSESFYPLDKRIERIFLSIGNSDKQATLRETLTRIKALRHLFKAYKPDAIIPFMHSMFIPAAFASIGLNVPVIASEHIVPAHYKNRKLEYFLLFLSSFFVDQITVLSQAVMNSYPSFLRKKMIVMPNPVSLNKEASKATVGENNNVILNIGRLTEQKDQETLIRAFALLSDEFPQWTVKIIGEGENQEKLASLITDLNLDDKVKLAGTTKHIENEYKSASIFALPSRYESFGLATAEAMLCGLAVIGFSDCPGTNELIQHDRNGLLVDPCQSRHEAFANGLKTLMSDQSLRRRLGSKGESHVRQYQPDKIVSRWENTILQTISH